MLPRTLKARSRPTDTPLQRHLSFFDDNGDRGVGLAECTRGLKALGLPIGAAEVAAFAIVAALSPQTRGSLLAMNVDIENAQKGEHDSDAGILDRRGRFNARRFDKVFGAHSTVDRNGDKAFTAFELTRMIRANRETLAGYVAAVAEWGLLLMIAADTHAVEGDQMSGWSVFYMESSGNGTIKCSNDQSMAVKLEARGGGLTFGKSTIDDGHGEFSGVSDISELIGSYASAEAHAGAVKSAKAQVVTKGEVSLALSGTGSGWDLGVAVGNFIITQR